MKEQKSLIQRKKESVEKAMEIIQKIKFVETNLSAIEFVREQSNSGKRVTISTRGYGAHEMILSNDVFDVVKADLKQQHAELIDQLNRTILIPQ